MTLFVGHLHEKIKDTTLRELFEPYGVISNIDRKGTYAFVEYESQIDTDRVVQELNKKDVLGTILRVELSNRERGEAGPPPGDLSETCYNCQRVGHIAKNCPVPIQPSQLQHLQRTQTQQYRYTPQSLYEQELAPSSSSLPSSSSHPNAFYQPNRPSKMEGFLDRNPQKIHLAQPGSQRKRGNPYTLPVDDGSKMGQRKRGKGRAGPRVVSSQIPYGSTMAFVERTAVNMPQHDAFGGDGPLDSLYSMGMQSMLSSGIMSMAGQGAAPPGGPAYDGGARHTLSATGNPSRVYPRLLPDHHGRVPLQNMPTTVPGATASHTPTIEHPYLPPGTLVYLPVITVPPKNQYQHPGHAYLPGPHGYPTDPAHPSLPYSPYVIQHVPPGNYPPPNAATNASRIPSGPSDPLRLPATSLLHSQVPLSEPSQPPKPQLISSHSALEEKLDMPDQSAEPNKMSAYSSTLTAVSLPPDVELVKAPCAAQPTGPSNADAAASSLDAARNICEKQDTPNALSTNQ